MTEATQHVGVTRSGRAVQLPFALDEQPAKLPAACSRYAPVDHFDAYAVFEYLLSRELSRNLGDARMVRIYQGMSTRHKAELDDDWRTAERSALGLSTIFDVLEHGKALTDRLFQD